MTNSFQYLKSLAGQCHDIVDVIHNFSSLIQCSGKRVSTIVTARSILKIQTDHTGVIYAGNESGAFIGDDPIEFGQLNQIDIDFLKKLKNSQMIVKNRLNQANITNIHIRRIEFVILRFLVLTFTLRISTFLTYASNT